MPPVWPLKIYLHQWGFVLSLNPSQPGQTVHCINAGPVLMFTLSSHYAILVLLHCSLIVIVFNLIFFCSIIHLETQWVRQDINKQIQFKTIMKQNRRTCLITDCLCNNYCYHRSMLALWISLCNYLYFSQQGKSPLLRAHTNANLDWLIL